MKDESEPITDDEVVLRAIWTQFYNPGEIIPVSQKAFLPRKDESTGISMFRAACVANPEDILVIFAEEKRDRYGIAAFAIAEFKKIGLSLLPDGIDEVAGHVVVPELSTVAQKADPSRVKELQKHLALKAGRNLLRVPGADGDHRRGES